MKRRHPHRGFLCKPHGLKEKRAKKRKTQKASRKRNRHV